VGTALGAADEQREYARIEHRGGVEAYLTAGVRLLAPGGVLVLCGDARSEERVSNAGAALGLSLRARTAIIARAGRPALFSVWTLRAEPGALRHAELVLRDSAGARTPDAQRLRRFSGLA
jgi:tRNA1(Val) A37 N6-methylase TrmN6